MDEQRRTIMGLAASATFNYLVETQFISSSSDSETDDPHRIQNYFELTIPSYHDKEFQSHFRISRQLFYEVLLPIVKTGLNNEVTSILGRPQTNVEKQLLAFLWLLATPDSYRSVGDRFNIAKSSLSKIFMRLIKAINHSVSDVIVWPAGQELEKQKERFKAISGFPNVIGVIDGTFIPIKAPKKDPEVYITRKCNYAFTLQAIVDSELKFTDIFIGYPGSVSDTRIFKNSYIYKNIAENKVAYFPNNEHILGDKAYPALTWCIPPYIERQRLTAAQKQFNLRLSQTRQTVERTFALFFGRFRRFKFLDMNRNDMIPATVMAGCVIHNLCVRNKENISIEDYITDGEQFIRHQIEDEVDVNVTRNLLDIRPDGQNDGKNKRDELCINLVG